MIYKYNKLKGVIKVGDKVRAVPGKPNACAILKDDGSNSGTITSITNDHDGAYFNVNNCAHYFSNDAYLEIIDSTPKTLETLEKGDIVINRGGSKLKILRVLEAGELYILGKSGDTDFANGIYTLKELQTYGYTVLQPEPTKEEPTITLTLQEIADKFGIEAQNLRIAGVKE